MSEQAAIQLILDRVEEAYAVFENEDGGFIQLPRELLPESYTEGNVFSYNGTTLIPLSRKTAERAAAIRQKMDLLFSDPPEDS